MTDPEPLCAVDANFILRFIVEDVPSQYTAAAEVMRDLATGVRRVVCDPVILAEVVYVLISHYDMSREEAARLVFDIVRAEGFLIPDKRRYMRALTLYATSVPHFADACACAGALERCEGRLYSFDKKLSHVEGVTRLERAVAKKDQKG